MNTTSKKTTLRTILKILLPLLIIGLGLAGSRWLNMTRPKPQKTKPPQMAPLVRTQELRAMDYEVRIPAMGKVVPAKEITLSTRVSGEVISVSPGFIPGGTLEKREEVLRIDPSDYRLELTQAESDLVEAEYALEVEKGKQNVARREWDLMKGDDSTGRVNPDLALRKPHLRKARADIDRAGARLKQAELNLKRTRIKAPFNAIVKSKNVDMGSQVAARGEIAELVDTDRFWIRASVPSDRLGWFEIPTDGSGQGAMAKVEKINAAPAGDRQGRVIRLLPDLEEEGRMARILIRVKDPLNLEDSSSAHPLLLGSFVRLTIHGRTLENVLPIPRDAWRDQGRIWLATPDGKLEIRSPRPLWKGMQNIYIRDNIDKKLRLITSDIPAPVQGMKLKIASEES
ncbi:MAG: efflux RND transporter periplasmic adaptor subunit [Thermodesulfobacteriota bacterium]